MSSADPAPLISDAQLAEMSYCAASNSRRLARAITLHFDRAMEPLGLRITQASLLVSIGSRGEVTVRDLSIFQGLDHSTLVRNLARLRDAGLVTSTPGTDRRTRSIALTPLGEEKLTKLLPRWEEAQQVFVDAFGVEGWKAEVERMDHILKVVESATQPNA